MKLSDLRVGQRATILQVEGSGIFRKRILEMGFVRGKEIRVERVAPLGDPVYYRILNYNVSLRREDAARIQVSLLPELSEAEPAYEQQTTPPLRDDFVYGEADNTIFSDKSHTQHTDSKRIRVALVGNPNCGKTTLFNLASGAHERVGNYGGVTIEAKEAHFNYKGYRIDIIDLPGSYSLSPYSPEELYIRQYLTGDERPDVVLNVVDTTNLERNLYLTLQVKELGLPVVMALNMFDEFEKSGDRFDHKTLSRLLGIPMEPTISRTGFGIDNLFDRILSIFYGQDKYVRPIKINYGTVVEPFVEELQEKIREYLPEIPAHIPTRYVAVKLLEQDEEVERSIKAVCKKADFILTARNYALESATALLKGERVDTVITDQRYGYIVGALRETYHTKTNKSRSKSDRIDRILVHRIWGLPVFALFMLIMFEATFVLGEYPMNWIEWLVNWLKDLVGSIMPDGSFKALLVGGIIGGVGGVIVFLPNILILYFFISLMEDTGYMSRAAFIMDKLMHRMGLHGKSFIPMVMGFGCNVPAIMATRTIESKKSRMITMLVLPFMSCSARLPVYLLLAGIFFPNYTGFALFCIYLLGILLAVGMARLLKATAFKGEDVPFVMELPPYRIPTTRSVLVHMWERSRQYLKKMGTVILLASIIVWFLGYFPQNNLEKPETLQQIAQVENSLRTHMALDTSASPDIVMLEAEQPDSPRLREEAEHIVQQENSYIGRIGKFMEPVMNPLGFDWKVNVALLTGVAAKEIVVSTLGVIYAGNPSEDEGTQAVLSDRIKNDRRADGTLSFTPLVAVSLMIFVLIYLPCVAVVVAIGKEAGHWRWAAFSAVSSCLLAWLISFIVYQGGLLLGL